MTASPSAAPRQVTFNRHRFLQTYRHVAFALQLLSGVATTATFVRVCEQRHLPFVFLALPLLLFFVAFFGRLSPIRDAGVTAILVGATTGAVAGFVSTVVDNTLSVVQPLDAAAGLRSDLAVAVCSLEFLHIPVIAGAVMYTFCLLFTRLPPLTLLVLALATAACGTTIFGIGLTLAHDPVFSSGGVDATARPTGFRVADWSAVLALTFVAIFVAALMPMLRINKRAWLVSFATLAVSSWWQAGFLETMQWDWDRSHFPIPGALVGIVVLFMIDVVEMTESADVVSNKRHHHHHHPPRVDSDQLSAVGGGGGDLLLSAITWHVGAYIVERTSLTMILDSRGRGGRSKPERRGGSDVWLCCLGMLGLVSICSSSGSRLFGLLSRNVAICLALALYVCVTLTGGLLANGYFIDDVLGLSLLVTTATSDFASSS